MSENINANSADTGDENKGQGVSKDVKNEPMIPKSRLDQVIQQKKDAEAALEKVVEGLIEDIPEDKRAIIPDLPAAQKIEWLRNAQKMGIFEDHIQESGPDTKRPGGKSPIDIDNLSPQEKMKLGYKT